MRHFSTQAIAIATVIFIVGCTQDNEQAKVDRQILQTPDSVVANEETKYVEDQFHELLTQKSSEKQGRVQILSEAEKKAKAQRPRALMKMEMDSAAGLVMSSPNYAGAYRLDDIRRP